MEFGSLADWVAGIGGFLAAIAAVVAWTVNKRMLRVEEERDARAEEREQRTRYRERRAQAGLVFALGAKLPSRTPEESWAIYLFNGSSKPVYNVLVESQKLNGSAMNHPLQIAALPPGRFVVPSHPQYKWGALVDLSLANEQIEFLVKGKGGGMIVSMAFMDADGDQWTLPGGTTMKD